MFKLKTVQFKFKTYVCVSVCDNVKLNAITFSISMNANRGSHSFRTFAWKRSKRIKRPKLENIRRMSSSLAICGIFPTNTCNSLFFGGNRPKSSEMKNAHLFRL